MRTKTVVLMVAITLVMWLGGCAGALESGREPLVELRLPHRIEWGFGKPGDIFAGRSRDSVWGNQRPIRDDLLERVRPTGQ